MLLATTYENGEIFQHFGRSEFFKVYDVENGEIKDSVVVSTNGQGHGALAGVLFSLGISVLICGGIGPGAQQALMSCGIQIFAGAEGDADAAVQAFLNGQLQPNLGACHHHDHEGGCGHHEGGCGHHEGGCAGHCGE